jgi:HlyD family secretion protein
MKREIGLIVSSALVLALGGCAAKEAEKEDEPGAAPVMVSEVTRGAIQRVITADGILRSVDQSAIVPKISAPVTKFYVNRGDHVMKGQLLAELENRDLAAAVADAKGTYDQVSAVLRNTTAGAVPEALAKAQQDAQAAKQAYDAAQKVLESRRALQMQGALAQRLVDEAGATAAQAQSQYETAKKHLESERNVLGVEDVKSAQAQVASAKGKLDAAEAQLSYAQVRSPIAGVVADRAIYPGEMATAGMPLLTVLDISSVIARVNVPIAQAAYLKVGQRATIASTDETTKVSGSVTVVSPAVDPNSTTVEAWVQAANPGEKLRPGGTVRVTIQGETVQNALIVPASAVLPGPEGGTAMLVVTDAFDAEVVSQANLHKVDLGIRTPGAVQILKGVNAGDKVVTEGGIGLDDGAEVVIGKSEAKKPGEDKKAPAKDGGKSK